MYDHHANFDPNRPSHLRETAPDMWKLKIERFYTKMTTSRPYYIESQKNCWCRCMSWYTIYVLSLKEKIIAFKRNWHGHYKNKMATSRPFLFESQKKMACTCDSICMITIPTLIQIGLVISEIQLQTRFSARNSKFYDQNGHQSAIFIQIIN